MKSPSVPQIVPILHNIRSIENVGAILRTAECLGVKKVIISGYTPNWKTGLPHIREKMEQRIAKIALGTEKLLEVTFSENIDETIASLKQDDFEILALEQHEDSMSLEEFSTFSGAPKLRRGRERALPVTTGKSESPGKVRKSPQFALILGEEVSGITQDLLSQADHILEIPQHGKKESLNVASATAIALYELTKSKNSQKRNTPPNCLGGAMRISRASFSRYKL